MAACEIQQTDEVIVDSYRKATTTPNQLAYNKLGVNKLGVNSLSGHNLSISRLGDGTLIADDLDGLETTDDGRELLTYIMRCALNEGDVLEATYSGNTYEFPGLLGLVPEWETRGLTSTEKQIVSSCLIAHVNAFGISVVISARMIDKLYADATERSTYRDYEGTFFGETFTAMTQSDPIFLYSCQGDDYDIAIAHSPTDRANRACTDGDEGCGDIVALGRCRDVCDTYSDEYGWTGCWVGTTRYANTMSIFLGDADPDSANDTCGASTSCTGGSSLATESSNSGTRAILSCRDSVDCAAKCEDDDVCTLDGADSTGTFTATVDPGAIAKVDAYNAHDADVTCTGSGTECEIDCKTADSCDATCTSGASCLLECADATSCGFASCHAGSATSCGNGVWVCGRSCP